MMKENWERKLFYLLTPALMGNPFRSRFAQQRLLHHRQHPLLEVRPTHMAEYLVPRTLERGARQQSTQLSAIFSVGLS